jgi:hypothetical protein
LVWTAGIPVPGPLLALLVDVSEKRVVTSYQVDEDDESEEGAERPKDY